MVSATLSGHSLHEEVQFLEWKTSVASSLVMAMTVTTVRLLSRLDGRACGVACVGLGLEQPLRALLECDVWARLDLGATDCQHARELGRSAQPATWENPGAAAPRVEVFENGSLRNSQQLP